MVTRGDRNRTYLFGIVCTLVFVSVFVVTGFVSPTDRGDFLTRHSARVAVLLWGVAVGALLVRRRESARHAWVWGCLTFVLHVVCAFDRVHGWSHSAAMQHIHDESGFGPGIFVSYAFTLLWVADAAWWQFAPNSYDRRAVWLDRGIHLFMAFIVFNGTVVYETGFVRWAGLAMFLVLGALLVRRKG